jgi:catechol 2,3-dioxygenase-like lactoylglutathione lyase family enzyme
MELKEHDIAAVLPAADIDRARRFYEETLGFEPESAEPAGIIYRSGSSRFTVYPTEFAGTSKHTQAGWLVDDIRKTVADLRERGVEFQEYDGLGLRTEDGVADLGSELAAWFTDSEGNIVALFQLIPGGSAEE